MQLGMSMFDDLMDFFEVIIVWVIVLCDVGGDVVFVKDVLIFIVVVIMVGVDVVRMVQRFFMYVVDWYDGFDQWNQLGDVVVIGVGQDCCDWCFVGVGCDVVF